MTERWLSLDLTCRNGLKTGVRIAGAFSPDFPREGIPFVVHGIDISQIKSKRRLQGAHVRASFLQVKLGCISLSKLRGSFLGNTTVTLYSSFSWLIPTYYRYFSISWAQQRTIQE